MRTKPNTVAQTGELENITVVTAAGKVYNLGKPTSVLYPLRLKIYKARRKHG